ncbi:MAG: hypothetical protein O2954_09600 [bacterium]|nr:hypothetical protein [bacterium]
MKLSIGSPQPAKVREEELRRLHKEATNLSKKIADLELMQARLTRNIDTYKSTYGKFLNLLEDARVAKANQPGDLKIAVRAVEAVRVPSETQLNTVFLATAMGLVLSVFLAFFLEYVQKAKERMPEGA